MGKRSGIHVRSTIFVLLLLLGAFFVLAPGTAVADQDGDYIFTTSGSGATITGYAGAGGAIAIPPTLGGYATVAIGDSAFLSCTSLTSVTIPNSVTSIGNNAFRSCTSLTSVTIGSGVTSVGDMAFRSCTSLTSVTIPNSVTSIGDGAFSDCTSLTSVTIPDSVTSIGRDALAHCTSLTSVTIPDNVTSIGDGAFSDCTSLAAIDVNTANPNYASVDGVLYDKAKTTLIQCPGGKAGSVTIPSSVTSIGERAFYYCTALTSVTIGSGVTHIGSAPFAACTALTAITVDTSNMNYASLDGVLYNKTNTTLIQYPVGNTQTSFTIPGSVTSIGDGAFYSCTSLTSVTIPSSVTSIGLGAFYSCTSLTSVTIPSSVTSIGLGAFYSCTSLTSVIIGSGVTTIGPGAFQSCTSLTSVTIPDNVTSIGDGAFYSCTSLTSVTIGSGVTTIGAGAFMYCTSLTSIIFLGLVAPTTVGDGWILDTHAGITGHAYAASNFPAPGGVFHGLTMGAVIPVVPDVPTGLTATPGNAQVVLAWAAPASDGGSPITGYKLYRSTTSGGAYALIASPTALTYTDTGLTNGQTYWYKVSAVNANGEGANCSAVSVLVPQPVSPASDSTTLILVAVIAIAVVLAAVLFVLSRRKGKK